MTSAKSVGRVMAFAFLVQVVLAPPVYFRLMPLGTGPDFLATAPEGASQVRVALLLAFFLGAMTLTAAIATLPIIRRHSERMAFLFLGLSVLNLATLAIESIVIRNMLSLSLEHAKTGAPNELLRTLGRVARSTWIGAHFTNLMVAHSTGFVLYIIFYRFALVPRALAAFGIAATFISTTAVTMPLLGYRFQFPLLVPTALSTLALILWLAWKGLEDRPHLNRGEASGVGLARA